MRKPKHPTFRPVPPLPTTSLEVTEVEVCRCTNTALEAGRTCGLRMCPNLNLKAS